MSDDMPGDDSLDDLFEPFELAEGPPPGDEPPPPPPVQQRPTTTSCPSCGHANPSQNRHCEECGARLGTGPLPIAPAPMVRATPGGRALGVLAAVVLIVALIALFINLLDSGGGTTDGQNGTSTTVSSTRAPIVTALLPTSVETSSELPRFEAENLIDSDSENSWNDRGLRGRDATLTFSFAQPVQISELEIINLTDDVRFRRNYRIQGYSIKVDDLAIEITGRLDDTNQPQRVPIASLETTELVISVTSTYPAESVDGQIPFDELAVQEIRFFGTTR